MGLLVEAALLAMLAAGTVVGTFASRSLFGKPSSATLGSFELALYVVIAALLSNYTTSYFSNSFLQALLVLFAGIVSAFTAGLVSTFAGKKGDKQEPRSLEELAQKRGMAERVFSALLDSGFPRSSARQCLYACGFSSEVVENVFERVKRNPAPHPVVKKIALLEEKLRGKRKSEVK